MDKSRGKILWIDDEIELLKPHLILLNQKGYEINTASNGEDGIELVKNNFFDIVFLDEMMLGMSGLDTLVAIKEINPYLPVVMVTKNEAETLMEEAIGRKIDDYLTKPVNPTQILAICKRYLESERINQEKVIQNFWSDTNLIRVKLNEHLDWQDWIEIYVKLVEWSLELDKYPYIGLSDSLRDIFREANAVFSNYVELNYKEIIHKERSEKSQKLSPDIVDKYVIPNLDEKTSLFLFVIDCLRLDQWIVMEEVLQQYFKIQKDYYMSILPTATPYARNAIFAGLFPYDIQKHYSQFWVGELNTEDHKQNAFEKDLLLEQLNRKKVKLQSPLTYIKIHETEFGKKIENDIHKYAKNQLTSIVVNSVDMIAHSRSDYAILKEIAPNESAYRSLTRSWFSHSSLLGMLQTLAQYPNVKIVLTTDHGSIRCMRGVKVLGDRETSTSLRYKFGKNVKCDQRYAMQINDLTEFKLPKISITVNNIIAKEDYYFVYPTDYHYYLQRYKDSFQHGGISMEEMIVPIVVLEPKIA